MVLANEVGIFYFFGHVLFQFLCNLQQYCDSAYNKLNRLQQKEFINITKMNYIWREKNIWERRRQVGIIVLNVCKHRLKHNDLLCLSDLLSHNDLLCQN